ncbi:FMN-binding protein [Amnibacterium sp.]|uniref:FMN-binding protein n=1 Tax=Amnibacterium sp. TaxID=1872496 RepID=UPI003F7BD50D
MPHLSRLLLPASIGSLALLGLVGCSTPASRAATPAASIGTLKDGHYTALGKYVSPGGASAVDVELTLRDGTVTELHVTPKAENPTAQQYESHFASGVGAQAVGRKITELNVTKVSGSSLTSQGFDDAIAAIEAEAR